MSIHDEHRARKRKQFRRTGFDSFSDHEVLEMLLFYAIPRRDTNEIAHELLNRFHTLKGVFSASEGELCSVKGIGENAAVLLKMIIPIMGRMRSSVPKNKAVMLDSIEKAGEYFSDLLYGKKTEYFYEACIDASGKLIECYCIADGSADLVETSTRKIVENALKSCASAVIIAHNHPNGDLRPSGVDNSSTMDLKRYLGEINVKLLDHIIVTDDSFVSMHKTALI